MNTQNFAKRQSGFNLIESAIVLGVVGLIIGGIWVAAGAVTESNKIRRARGAILTTTQNIQHFFYGRTSMIPPVGDVTSSFISAELVSGDLVLGTTCQNPWGGACTITSLGGNPFGGTPPRYYISFSSLPKSACIKLLLAMNTLSGLESIYVPPNSINVFPVTPSVAALHCYNNSMEIRWYIFF